VGGQDVSSQTKGSIRITQTWQRRLIDADPKRYISEYPVSVEMGSRGHKIDLYDAVEKVAYELKVSPNNPHHEFYKDIFKIAYANRDEKVVEKMIFCCHPVAYLKLGALANYASTQATKLGFEVVIIEI
jgi:hypothetical protein